MKKNQRVYWNDPDEGICSGWGAVISYQKPLTPDSIISLLMESGGEVECFQYELDIPA
jgi:hypothetical protein